MVVSPWLLWIVLTLCICFLAYCIYKLLKARGITNLKDRLETENELIRTPLQLVVGIVLAAGLMMTFVDYNESRDQFRQSIELTKRSQLSNRMSEAITMLKDTTAIVRVAAIYEMGEAAAQLGHNKRNSLTEVVAEYLRSHLKNPPIDDSLKRFWPGADVLAALEVLTDIRLDERTKLINLRWLNLDDAILEGVNFDDCDLRGASFRRAELAKTSFVNSCLEEVDFEEARLLAADFTGARLRETNFIGCMLSVANFTNADLSGTRMQRSNLLQTLFHNTELKGADLSEVEHLTNASLRSALGDSTTILPQYVAYPPHW